jgi:hypothetical protein
VHFTTGGDHGKYGDCVPGIWTCPNKTTLHLSDGYEGKHHNTVNASPDLDINKEVVVRLRVQGSARTVWFGDKKVVDRPAEMGARQAFENVKVYIGDPWHEPANAQIRNLRYTDLNEQGRSELLARASQLEGVRFGKNFLQLGEWRFGDVDGRHFSVVHKDGKTAEIYREDGTLHPGPRTDFHTLSREFNDSAPGISFGDRFIQIGVWRIGDIDGVHASICNLLHTPIHGTTTGKTALIFRSDGTLHPGARDDYRCDDRAIDSNHANVPTFGTNYMQIGAWRFGMTHAGSGGVGHASVSSFVDGAKKTALIYRSDGTLHKLYPRDDYCLW